MVDLPAKRLAKRAKPDPIKSLTCRYPRVLVLKAAFRMLKDGKRLSLKELEIFLEKLLKN
ncbi:MULTISPECIES: hypothetical protein [Kosmotoga]|jgi:hypothetical protein|uniref:Uncharacterized protein n=1 Tax=Kosmotoga olearia (strain ATCC BAA-1733 / DSM 21960 / TBF 19.5.1) TaxID=521045 RepID=C5CDY8_KOSOT|nr:MULTISPECIES: hypothetical protein [Kosmotoga]ACR80090.1 hypothetical protein Kole_1397 [Kosmotoga olearia TBF 19.5.1]MDI3523630.1 hypothetical protein [Kosmotoga sp.]MDK2953522.1 hypothetical protein [Kosmotoga sp.]OAA20440.1 hypothetical protein DU53_07700 [Kosmotoga sp. DU53]